MYVSGLNSTDADCFQKCNDDWNRSFNAQFNLSATDFYDFPLHPAILDHAGYLSYCQIAEAKTRCYMDQCDDHAADQVFSPANFLCRFKKRHFLEARSCLADTEPITFLKCDQQCHLKAQKEVSEQSRAALGQVFSRGELNSYERELDLLCTFQQCYRECQRPIVLDSCSRRTAASTIALTASYISWHASDIYDFHIISMNMATFPASCAQAVGEQTIHAEEPDDPIVRIMNNVQ